MLVPLRWPRIPLAFHKSPESDPHRQPSEIVIARYPVISTGNLHYAAIFKPTSALVDFVDKEPLVHRIIAGSDGLFDVFKEHPTRSE